METTAEKIVIDPNSSFRKLRALILVNKVGETITAVVPIDFTRRAARKVGMSIEDFVKSYESEWLYGEGEGAYISFIKKETTGKETPES